MRRLNIARRDAAEHEVMMMSQKPPRITKITKRINQILHEGIQDISRSDADDQCDIEWRVEPLIFYILEDEDDKAAENIMMTRIFYMVVDREHELAEEYWKDDDKEYYKSRYDSDRYDSEENPDDKSEQKEKPYKCKACGQDH